MVTLRSRVWQRPAELAEDPALVALLRVSGDDDEGGEDGGSSYKKTRK